MADTEVLPTAQPPARSVPPGNGELVLVTGGTGYLGCHVVRQLVETGQFRVRATVRSMANENKVKPLLDVCPPAKKDMLELVEADLDKTDSWASAVKDCTFVIHVASPFPATDPDDGDALVKLAVDGTLSVLRAAHAAGTVRRVVLTSSVVAIMEEGSGKKMFNEDDWSDPAKCSAYSKSKTLAERAAWDFVKQLPESEKFELVVINPGYILGPALTSAQATSFEVIKRLLNHDMPLLPRLQFLIVDVRDVALAHVHALTLPGVAGMRFILAPHSAWVKDIAVILDKEYKKQGYNVPTTQAPYVFIWLKAQFDPTVKMILPMINQAYGVESTRMKDILLVTPRELKDTVLDMANSLIEKGIIQKKVARSLSRTFSLKRFRSKGEQAQNSSADGATATNASAPVETVAHPHTPAAPSKSEDAVAQKAEKCDEPVAAADDNHVADAPANADRREPDATGSAVAAVATDPVAADSVRDV